MVKENFFDKVYEVVKKIPKGRVTTYGEIARYLGATKSSRMVGWALNNSHTKKNIPAHRVVNRNGVLTGKFHFKELHTMEKLLKEEGVEVYNDKVKNFKDILWKP